MHRSLVLGFSAITGVRGGEGVGALKRISNLPLHDSEEHYIPVNILNIITYFGVANWIHNRKALLLAVFCPCKDF